MGRPLPAVLKALCRWVDASAEGGLSTVLLLDRTRTRIRQAIGPGVPMGCGKVLEGLPLSVELGPWALAATLRTEVVVSDISSNPRWDSEAWPALALAHGLRSCWCSPLLSLSGELVGAFAIYRREAGSPTPFHLSLTQRFTHIASIAVERAHSEEALKRNEAFLAKAQQLSSTGSFSWRVATDEITWSEELSRIFELDPAEPLTLERIRDRFHPDDLPVFHEAIQRGRGGDDFEHGHRLLLPDGSVKYVHVIGHGTRGQDGELEYIGAIQDVTARRRSEEALGKARSELARVARVTTLGALTASVAHEVNQPLSGIMTNARTGLRMLSADPPNVEGARETARRTLRDGQRAADVIARLRDLFARKEPGREPVDLNEATREVIALCRSELQWARVTVQADLADALPPVTGDRVQLQQVILNLVLNGSEAMSKVEDRPRQLVIQTEADEGDRVRLTVRETGAGFAAQDGERLFDAFYTTKSSGIGIGLSVSRSIIESHGGPLWGAPNDGPGATFAFSIPRVRSSRHRRCASFASSAARSGGFP